MSKTKKNQKNEDRRPNVKFVVTNPCDCCDNTNADICINCPYCSSAAMDYCYDEDDYEGGDEY